MPAAVYRYVVRSGAPVLSDDLRVDRRFARAPSMRRGRARSALCVPIKSRARLTGAVYLENDGLAGAFAPDRAELVTLLAGQMAVSIEIARLYANLEERVAERTAQLEARNAFIRQVFGRYMSDEVVDTLLESQEALKLGGERRVVTLMFTDLRGFTAMCDQLTPEHAVGTLNTYLSVMTGIVQRHGGSINNIRGDGLLVLFGAPVWREAAVDGAVACALQMQLAMPEVDRRNAAEGLPTLAMGIGLHVGEVVVGNVGSQARARYSVIGRHVNLASRVEGVTLGGEVVVSAAVRDAAIQPLIVSGERRIQPRGISEPLSVFSVVGVEGRDDLQLPEVEAARGVEAGPAPHTSQPQGARI